MSSNVDLMDWKRFLIFCEWLEYQPEAAVQTNLLHELKTLYTQYRKDKGLQFNPSRNLDSGVMQNISVLLYLSLCETLGYESIIQNKRNITNLVNTIHLQMNSDKGYVLYRVGSTAEGLSMHTSDMDNMVLFTDNVVVNNTTEKFKLSLAKLSNVVITMETQHTKPGYVRLILETDKSKTCERISSSCHDYDGKLYISSTKYREYRISSLGKMVEVHGPCTTTKYGLSTEDIAHCLSCTSQPAAVQNWMMRCNKYNWPDSVVLEKCISLGCQLAPVGSKESPHEHLEWRISFILMEKTILQSLSHSHFMCYGLLKVYLKEVLGSFEEIKDLVSSYFMKTVLIWEIQTNNQRNGGPDSLLQLFWNCLRRLYTWVKTGKCPNFFIPENNMFENRIYHESKHTFQNILELLLREKFYGLHRCQSINLPKLIFQALINEKQSFVVSVNESMYITKEAIEGHVYLQINTMLFFFQSKHSSITDLSNLLRTMELILKKDSLTDLEKRAVQTWISGVNVCINIHNFKDIIAPNVSPDIKLEKYNLCCNIFRAHDHKISVTPLYLATLMYITGRYHACLDVIIECNKRLKGGFQYIVYVSVNLQLTELRLELESKLAMDMADTKRAFLHVDARLYASMLSVLCHYHLSDGVGTEIKFQLLREIPSDMSFIQKKYCQQIYWQILGICGEIIGKYDEAYQSYVRAYKSPNFHLLDNAPLLRVLCLIYKLLPK